MHPVAYLGTMYRDRELRNNFIKPSLPDRVTHGPTTDVLKTIVMSTEAKQNTSPPQWPLPNGAASS